MKYQTKVVTVDAYQVGSEESMPDWVTKLKAQTDWGYLCYRINGNYESADMGDWFIRYADGDIRLLDEQEFETLIEKVK